MSKHSNTTVFMGTLGGGFAWMDVDIALHAKLFQASGCVVRYGFQSVCLAGGRAVQFPMMDRVHRTLFVDDSSFWIEAVSERSGERDQTCRVLIRDVRDAALAGQDMLLCLDRAEGAFHRYLGGMSTHERVCLFGYKVADELSNISPVHVGEHCHG